METLQFVVDVDLAALGEAVWAVIGSAGTMAIAVLGWLIFGPRYKQRIAALEARPSLNMTFNYPAPPDSDGSSRAMEEAIGQETLRGLDETMRGLVQEPLEGGHTFARLPHGTNIVSMANGEYRLALPVRAAGIGTTPVYGRAMALTVTKAGDPPDEKSEEKSLVSG